MQATSTISIKVVVESDNYSIDKLMFQVLCKQALDKFIVDLLDNNNATFIFDINTIRENEITIFIEHEGKRPEINYTTPKIIII